MTQVQAVSAAAFSASLGVNVHLGDYAGPYGNLSLLESELSYLGISQVRDNQPYSTDVGAYETLAAAGLKLDLIIGHNPDEAMSTSDLKADLAVIDQIVAADPGSIIGLEGLNEPYNFPNTWNGQSTSNWSIVQQVQAAEYALVKADPKLSNVPVLSTSTDLNSFPGGTAPNLSSVADFGNAHVYPYQGLQPPFVMNNIVSGQTTIVPGKPSWITEFGYSTAYQDPNYGADQATQAKNTLNGLLEAFKDGVPKTFIYQLNDEIANPSPSDVQDGWGLFNSDGSRKLAATAIHNLTSILSDPGATAQTFKPGMLDYTISNLPSTGQSMLIEKSNGTFELAVWNDAVDWNASNSTAVSVAPTTVTVSLGATYANISVFDPMSGTTAIASSQNANSVQIRLTDHPLIIQLSGGTGTSTPTSPPSVTPSPNGTKITTAGQGPITDQAGNAWTLVSSTGQGQQIAVNGTVDAATANVTLLEYLNGSIVQENTSGNWYSEPGPTGPWTQISAPSGSAPATPSPNGTKITTAGQGPITDQAGNAWTLVSSTGQGQQIAVNGRVDAVTSNVTLLEYLNGSIVQENTSGNWYSEPGPKGPWTQISPITPSISVTATGSGKVNSINGTKMATTTASGARVAVTSPGVAKVSIGATSAKLQFIAMSSVSVTAGSAAAQVTADGGTNTFTAGAAALTVTGGAGADAYIYHAGNALLTVQDFALGKGDTLKIDKSLQSALTETSDGAGGVMLSFGTAGKGIDIRDMTAIPSSQLHFV